MQTIRRLWEDAREWADINPVGNAEPMLIQLFNAKLDEYKQRYPDDQLIKAVQPVAGEISNSRMFTHCNALRIAAECVVDIGS
jgi:hypothetical protein